MHTCQSLLTVKGWAGFLSLISHDSSTEFFIAAFTLKLVAKTKKKKQKPNVLNSLLEYLLFCCTSFLPGRHSLQTTYRISSFQHTEPDLRLLPWFGKMMLGLGRQWQDNDKGHLNDVISWCVLECVCVTNVLPYFSEGGSFTLVNEDGLLEW